MPATAVQLPFVKDPAARTGRTLWRKRILPVGVVTHPEHGDLVFDKGRLTRLRETYLAGAMDQVPFVLVDAANRHTDDPERFRGDVKGLDVESDGLYATIETTADGTKLLGDNPNLPVSVRLKTLSDGQEALAHTAGTFDPVATKLGPWQSIDASNDLKVTDFSDRGTFTLPDVTDTKKVEGKDDTAADALSKEEVGKFRSFLQGLTGSGGDKPPAKPDAEMPTDAELAVLLAGVDADDTEPVTASLSDEDQSKLDMSHTGVLDLTARLGVSELAGKLDAYLKAGVPPALVNPARKALLGDKPGVADLSDTQKAVIIDFANGKTNPASDALFAALDAAKGTIDFSEKGTTAATVIDMEDEKTKSLQKAADDLAKGYI